MSGISVNRVANIVCQILLRIVVVVLDGLDFAVEYQVFIGRKSKYIVNVVDLIVWCVLDWLDYVKVKPVFSNS